jgi:hypothetical protein
MDGHHRRIYTVAQARRKTPRRMWSGPRPVIDESSTAVLK